MAHVILVTGTYLICTSAKLTLSGYLIVIYSEFTDSGYVKAILHMLCILTQFKTYFEIVVRIHVHFVFKCYSYADKAKDLLY